MKKTHNVIANVAFGARISLAKSFKSWGVALLIMPAIFTQSYAQSPKDFESLIPNEAIGIAFINIDKIDLPNARRMLSQTGVEDKTLEQFTFLLTRRPQKHTDDLIAKLRNAGIKRMIGFIRAEDFVAGGTTWLVELTPPASREVAEKELRNLARSFSGPPKHGFKYFSSVEGGLIVTARKSQQLQSPDDRKDTRKIDEEIRKRVIENSAGILLFANQDSRKVIRELGPSLPAPFESITGQLIADKVQWAGILLNCERKPNISVEVQCADDSSAKVIASAGQAGVGLLAKQLEIKSTEALKLLEPVRTGSHVNLSTERLLDAPGRLKQLLSPIASRGAVSPVRNARTRSLRTIMLAMHNYYDAYRSLPPQYSAAEDGTPLLSWRVHILPFIEHGHLYEQFKLDEPWDSEHNRKLIPKMPALYKDAHFESVKFNESGKTLFQVPCGKNVVFHGPRRPTFPKISDGTSNTMAAIVVSHDNAAVWTQPDDWEVDLKSPKQELQPVDGHSYVVGALVDGSVFTFSLDASDENWQKMLRFNDGTAFSIGSVKSNKQ